MQFSFLKNIYPANNDKEENKKVSKKHWKNFVHDSKAPWSWRLKSPLFSPFFLNIKVNDENSRNPEDISPKLNVQN